MTLWRRIRRKLPASAADLDQASGELRGRLDAQQERLETLERALRESLEAQRVGQEVTQRALFELNGRLSNAIEAIAGEQREDLAALRALSAESQRVIQELTEESRRTYQELADESRQTRQEIEGRIDKSEKNAERVLHWRADRLESIGIRATPCAQLSFEVALAEHCNLRCAGCDHFSPVAEPELADLNEFSRDFARLSQLFSGRTQEIHLLGGEPLLHPDIAQLLAAARSCFPEAVIDVTTNGVLLGKMDEVFWEACREHGIVLRPTKYPIGLDYDALEALAEEHGVEYRYFGNTRDTLKTLSKYPLDVAGMQEPRRSFMLCYRANKCIYLQHGRLYTCTVAPTAHHLSRRFGLDMAECPEDSIDIYAAQSAGEILEFLSKPIPFCKYCMPEKAQNGLPWRPSEGELLEWTL